MSNVAVIGAGASGLMAAYAAALNGNDVTVYEKNEKSGKKIYITGKGRCNLTCNVEVEEYFNNVVTNPRFLNSCIRQFPPQRTMEFFENGGTPLKVERGNRVFPLSDKASDVTKCLEKYCLNAGVKIIFNVEIVDLIVKSSTISGIVTNKGEYFFDKVIVCTGGLSYPSTGSTGDGLKFAEKCGHKIVEPKPALCGMNVSGNYCKELQGLTLKNVLLSVYNNGKIINTFFGEMLFTHFGVSGPIILSASSIVNRLDLSKVKLVVDLKPALSEEQLDKRLLRDFEQYKNKSISNCLKELLPTAMIAEVLKRSGIAPEKKVNTITKVERTNLLTIIKNFVILISSLRSFNEAIITSGGVTVSEINPKTMESKIISGLYFCGEVLDVDAFTGGYNLQIAFATGYAAGISIK